MEAVIFFMLYTFSHFADYLVQADCWGWFNPIWRNGQRGSKWGPWDFIPHDPWHWAQFIRNTLWMALPAGIWGWSANWGSMWYQIGALGLMSILARGVGFSLMYKIFKEWK